MKTYLYVKQHSITGLKYFGKTTQDPYKYKGSGKYWRNHLKKHGRKDVITLSVWDFDNIDECVAFAFDFSVKNNIVLSDEWANLCIENGVDGGPRIVSEETREKHRQVWIERRKNMPPKPLKIKLPRVHSEETKRKISIGNTGKINSQETRRKISVANKGRKLTEQHKQNLSKNHRGMTGKTHSPETKEKMRLARLNLTQP